MIFNKKFYSIFFFLFIICSLSSCEKNEDKNLFSEENNEIINWDFLEEEISFSGSISNFDSISNSGSNILDENELEVFPEWEDFFEWAEFESENTNLWASIFDWVSMDWNYFKETEWVDLYKVTWYIDFWESSSTFLINWEEIQISLNPWISDKITWLKIAFADSNQNYNWIFNSISYWWYWMENIWVSNWKTRFDIYFDWIEGSTRSEILKKIFTSKGDFLAQIKMVENKKIWNSYIPFKIQTKVVSQIAENEDWWLLFEWPCLTSDFTYIENDFEDIWETFSSDFYEETNTWYFLDDSWYWDINSSENITNIVWLCAFNDTYNFNKEAVVWSQCWEWETKDDVWKLVFRLKEDSFCVQAGSIEDEEFYPDYACNIWTWKTIIDKNFNIQEYLWGDIFNLTWSSLSEIVYTCWED